MSYIASRSAKWQRTLLLILPLVIIFLASPVYSFKNLGQPFNPLRYINSLMPLAASAATQAPTESIRQLSLATKDIIYNPTTQMLYASLPSSAGAKGNSIAAINPKTGAIESTTYVGSEPGKVALSDDGKNLYVSLDGAASVGRFDIATQKLSSQFKLSNDSGGYYAYDIAVMPSNSDVVAVSRRSIGSNSSAGVAIYDNGVQRSSTSQISNIDSIDGRVSKMMLGLI